MPNLARFQSDFAAEIRRPAARSAKPAPITVYRNTVLLGAVEALADNYPVTASIVGERTFTALALAHARRFPPDDPVLADYGRVFASWLEGESIARELPYLADVARCERMWVEALHAEDAPALTPLALEGLAPEALLALRLRLHPATRFGWQSSPAVVIWHAHQDGFPGELEVAWRAHGAIFTRPDFAVEGGEIDAAAHRLLCGIRLGETLGEAARAASALYPDTAIGDCFGDLVRRGAFAARAN